MIFALIGSNSFALKRRLDELISAFVTKNGGLALERIDGEEVEPQAILEALQNLPFLAKKKMVIVRDPSKNKKIVEQIEQIISSTKDDVDLIFVDPEIDRRTSYFKVLKSRTRLEEFNELDSPGLARWLVNEAKKRGGQLNLSDAIYMVERLGTNQALLANELDKLLIYKPEITRSTIDLLTTANPQSKIFELLDAAFNGKKQAALDLYDEQRAQRVEPQAILAMISWQLQQIAIAKYAEGKSAGEIAKDSGMKDYPVRKAMGLATKLEAEKLKKLVSAALNIDLKAKTSGLDMDEALKTYIATM
ncbi:DNA polymerase III subunit delta [Candidatus Saccharibacteria bacterium]|nr:DNA polymerase III subunit delta [Candidatus Saccharibacteria bacterium]